MKISATILFIFSAITINFGQGLELCDQFRNINLGESKDTLLLFEVPTNETPPYAEGPPLDPYAEERVIFWLHGLGADEYSWDKVAEATQTQIIGLSSTYKAREVICYQPAYSPYAISTAAVGVHNNMYSLANGYYSSPYMIDPTRNIVIGHSQGGVVARYLDYQYHLGDIDDGGIDPEERQFGGVVTFNSPNMGAQIINNKVLLQDFANKACSEALDGPIYSHITIPTIESFFVSLFFEQIIDNACEFVAFDIVPLLMDDLLTSISEDYAVGADKIVTLNSEPSYTDYKVAFYGIETAGTEFWRELYSLQHEPNEFPYFEADFDQPLVDFAEENIMKSELKVDKLNMKIEALSCTWVQWIFQFNTCNFNLGLKLFAEEERKHWRTTRNWWQNANDYYLAAIGCLEDVTRVSHSECI
ncbi:MAG: hypothetical protein ABIV51_03390, partial [Saprospiraceae bacterium]